MFLALFLIFSCIGSFTFYTQEAQAHSLSEQHLITSAKPLTPQPYACINPHCYGIVDWGGAIGSKTAVEIKFITCGTCDGFVNVETWLTQTGNTSCPVPSGTGYTGNACWIEVGYSTWGSTNHHYASSCVYNSAANCYFWADNRPNGGYTEHVLGNIPTSDYGGNLYLTIIRSSSNHGDWTIQAAAPSNSWNNEQSSANPMQPNHIQNGDELYGTTGANAPTTDFFVNRWLDSNYNFQYQYTNGTFKYNRYPGYAYWLNPPQGEANYGGDLLTCTQGNSCPYP